MPDEHGRSPKSVLYNIFVYIPCSVMAICNIIIFVKLKVSSDKMSRKPDIFMLSIFLVFLSFLMTLLPSWIADYVDECFQQPRLHTISYIFLWAGSIINPIIFLVCQRNYRDAVRELFERLSVAVQTEETLKQSNTKMRIKTFRVKPDDDIS